MCSLQVIAIEHNSYNIHKLFKRHPHENIMISAVIHSSLKKGCLMLMCNTSSYTGIIDVTAWSHVHIPVFRHSWPKKTHQERKKERKREGEERERGREGGGGIEGSMSLVSRLFLSFSLLSLSSSFSLFFLSSLSLFLSFFFFLSLFFVLRFYSGAVMDAVGVQTPRVKEGKNLAESNRKH